MKQQYTGTPRLAEKLATARTSSIAETPATAGMKAIVGILVTKRTPAIAGMLAAGTQSTAGRKATAMAQATTTVTPTEAEMYSRNSPVANDFAENCEKLVR